MEAALQSAVYVNKARGGYSGAARRAPFGALQTGPESMGIGMEHWGAAWVANNNRLTAWPTPWGAVQGSSRSLIAPMCSVKVIGDWTKPLGYPLVPPCLIQDADCYEVLRVPKLQSCKLLCRSERAECPDRNVTTMYQSPACPHSANAGAHYESLLRRKEPKGPNG